MNSKCKKLINLLETENRYFSKKEICESLPEDFIYKKTGHDECVELWDIKNEINNNYNLYNVLIISNSKGDLKIPTKEELEKYLNHELSLCVKKFNRYWKKAKAFGLINQETIIGDNWKIVRNALN